MLYEVGVPFRLKDSLLFALLLGASPTGAEAADFIAGDFDGDRRADFSSAEVSIRKNETIWNVQLSSGENAVFSFAQSADSFVTGRFVGEKQVTPGIVTALPDRPLTWTIKLPNAGEVVLQYGLDGDIVPNLGDLDCDGITDITVVRNDGHPAFPGLKVWYSALSASAVVHQTIFGSSRDRAAIADLDGDGCGEMIALREGFHWFGLKLGGNSLSVVQWGLPGDIPLLPADMNQDGVPDYIVVRPVLGRHFAFVRYQSSQFDVIDLGPDGTIPMIGRYDNDIRFASATPSQSMFQVAGEMPFSFGKPSAAMIRPDGTYVDPGEDGRFFRADDEGVVSSLKAFDDQIGDGCRAPRIPDGKRKKRAWVAPHIGAEPRYYLSQRARVLQLFSSSGVLLDSLSLLDSGGKNGRELWEANRSAFDLERYAPLLLKETLVNGSCNWIDIEQPTVSWD